jgi:hypothetical protein
MPNSCVNEQQALSVQPDASSWAPERCGCCSEHFKGLIFEAALLLYLQFAPNTAWSGTPYPGAFNSQVTGAQEEIFQRLSAPYSGMP